MSLDLLRPVKWIEQRGADQGRDTYAKNIEHADRQAELFGIARMWKRITIVMYVVAIVMMVIPVGGAVRYIGVLLWTLGIFPLICWIAQRFLYRKAVKAELGQ